MCKVCVCVCVCVCVNLICSCCSCLLFSYLRSSPANVCIPDIVILYSTVQPTNNHSTIIMQINKQLFLALAHTHTYIITQAARERTTAHPLHTIMHRAIDQDPYPLPTRSTRTSKKRAYGQRVGSSQTMVCTVHVCMGCVYHSVSVCVCVCVCVCV